MKHTKATALLDLDNAVIINDEAVYLILIMIGAWVIGYLFGRIIRNGIETLWPSKVPISEEGEEFLGKRKVL